MKIIKHKRKDIALDISPIIPYPPATPHGCFHNKSGLDGHVVSYDSVVINLQDLYVCNKKKQNGQPYTLIRILGTNSH